MALYRPCACGKKSPKYKGHRDHHGSWYFGYYEGGRHGKHVRLNLGTPDRRTAEKIKGDMMKDSDQGRDPSLRVIKARPWRVVVEEFIEKHVKVNIKPRSRQSYENRTRAILDAFDGRTIQAVTTKAIREFVAERRAAGVSGATCNRHVAHISKVFNWAAENDYFGGSNPAKAVKRAQESPGRDRYLTADEAQRLVDEAPDHLKPIITTALHNGGRLTEVLSLRWEDVDLERGILYFDQTNTKSGKQRDVPITPELAATLRQLRGEWKASGHLFTWAGNPIARLTTAFNKARDCAGLGEDVTFHVLRHTFACWYMMNGGDLFRLQRYMGHSDIKLTQRYADHSPGHRAAGVVFIGPPKAGGSRRQNVDNISDQAHGAA